MIAHVFERTLSPICTKYTLRHNATDNEDEFGKEAAVTLEKNFYVDHLLKSFNTINKS